MSDAGPGAPAPGWLALMPLRGGSKSIPGKNVRELAGRPLFAWSLSAVVSSGVFERVLVATDAAAIADRVRAEFGDTVEVIGRSAATATDTASSESVMLEVLEVHPCAVMALVQATSPLTQAADFRAAHALFERERLDALLTAVATHRFFWTRDGRPLNYDPLARPRRQDFAGSLMENGAFYFTRASVLERTGNRLGGRIGIYEMAPDAALEVDEPVDLAQVVALLEAREGGQRDDR